MIHPDKGREFLGTTLIGLIVMLGGAAAAAVCFLFAIFTLTGVHPDSKRELFWSTLIGLIIGVTLLLMMLSYSLYDMIVLRECIDDLGISVGQGHGTYHIPHSTADCQVNWDFLGLFFVMFSGGGATVGYLFGIFALTVAGQLFKR